MNELMTALVAENSEEDQLKKPKAMVSVKFKYRKLGVNAQANNYAFADDCYSQWTVSPKGRRAMRKANYGISATLSISQSRLRHHLSRP